MRWRRAGAALKWLLSWGFLQGVVPAALIGYVAALAGIALVSVFIGVVLSRSSVGNVAMLYLLIVLPTAIRFGRSPAIVASVVALLTFDWFFVQPLHTLATATAEEWIALVLFLAVAVATGQLAARERRRADEAQRREREAVALREVSRILNATDDLDGALYAVCDHLRAALTLAGCAALVPGGAAASGRTVVRASAGEAPAPAELGTAEWLSPPAQSAIPPGADSPGRRWVRIRPPARAAAQALHRVVFVPLPAGEHTVGMLRLAAAHGRPGWTPEERRLINAAAEQIGRTIERTRLRHAATEAEVLRKTEEVRQAVLASLSHDLRTPLASIKGAAESLSQRDMRWLDEERYGFAAAIVQESDRLSRLVDALLDMSRIEAGRLYPDLAWYPLDSLVDDVLGRLEGLTAGHVVRTDVPETLPPVPLDYVQIGEVLSNLVENAAKYTPPGSEILVAARREDGCVRVVVQDNGPGIPPAALPHVFEKFYRVSGGDQATTKGTGLGLAVARGFVEAHGGSIEAQSPPLGQAHGAAFIVRLPLRSPAGAVNGVDSPALPVDAAGPDMDAAAHHAGGSETVR